MRTELAVETTEFYGVLRSALAAAGGVDILRRCEADPHHRQVADTLLGELGVWGLDPRRSSEELEAAAIACRAAGAVALPYPVAERIAAEPGAGYGALAVVGGKSPRIHMADIELDWVASDGSGRVAEVVAVSPILGSKLGGFVCDVELGEWRDGGDADLMLTLQAWAMLGLAEAAAEATYTYVKDRHQFGQPIANNQAVQFRLTDVEVSLQALEELAKYTLWSVGTGRPGAPVDVTGLRLAALETSELVFRVGHQLHGAIGFCDETDISWLSRFSQPLRRLPWGLSQTEERLLHLVEMLSFDGLFLTSDLVGALH